MYKDDETFKAFAAWCKTKPADEEYDYEEPGSCAFAQFLRETGRAVNPSVVPDNWRDLHTTDPVRQMDQRLDGQFYDLRDPLQAGTFGGILKLLMENGHV